MRVKGIVILLLLLVAALALPTGAKPGTDPELKDGHRDAFSALAELPVAGSTLNVTIYLNSYSTPEDAQRLHSILADNGATGLLKALQKMKPIGRIERTGTIGFYDFKFILSKPTPGGRHIYAVTDRPIGFLEAYYSSRSKDYPFGILELDLKSDEDKGKEKGEGTLIYAAKLKLLDSDRVDIENVTFAPIRLLGVRKL